MDNNNSITFTATNVTIMEEANPSNQRTFRRSNDGLWRVPLSSIPPFLPSSPSLSVSSAMAFTNNFPSEEVVDTPTNESFDDNLLLLHNVIPNHYSTSLNTSANNNTNSYSARVKSLTPNDRTILNKVVRLHQRMGHPSAESMCMAISGPNSMWTNSNLTAVQVRKVFNHYSCVACILSKRNHPGSQKSPNNRGTTSTNTIIASNNEQQRSWLPGDECITADMLPRINPSSINGDNTIFIFEDVATGHLWAIPGKDEDSGAFIEALNIVYGFIYQHGRSMKVLRVDGGGNLNSALVQQWLVSRRITSENSAPYQQYQNEVERHVQTTLKGVSTLLFSREFIRSDLWNYALIHYLATKNNTPNKKNMSLSPSYIFTNQKVDLHTTFLFAFGDIVIIVNIELKPEKIFKFIRQ